MLREKAISDFTVSLDLETFKEVLEWLPSELRGRIIDRANIEKLGQKHPAVRWAVFIEEKESELLLTSPNKDALLSEEEGDDQEKLRMNNSKN